MNHPYTLSDTPRGDYCFLVTSITRNHHRLCNADDNANFSLSMKEMTQSRVAYNKIGIALQTCYTNGVAAIVLHYICLDN